MNLDPESAGFSFILWFGSVATDLVLPPSHVFFVFLGVKELIKGIK